MFIILKTDYFQMWSFYKTDLRISTSGKQIKINTSEPRNRVDFSIWFKTVGDNANRLPRNTAYRKNLVATRSRTDIRKNFFSNRVINLWNNLPTDVKDVRTVKLFKARLEKINL